MTREEAIVVLKNEQPHCGKKALFPEEKKYEAFDMAIKALEQEPCEDAISRQAVLEAIDAKAWEFCDYLISKNRNDEQKPVSHFADNLRECVREELPSINPQPKTGRWIEHFDEIGKWYECDQCHTDWGGPVNYCPNCGAKME